MQTLITIFCRKQVGLEVTRKPHDSFRVVVALLCVVLAVAFTAIVYSVQVTDLQNQINSLQSPKLVNINLNYIDNDAGNVHVSGYVYNSGSITAYDCHVQVDLYRDWMKTDASLIYFGNDTSNTQTGSTVYGETAVYVDGNVTYTGSPPTNVTLTLGWMAPWQIPIP